MKRFVLIIWLAFLSNYLFAQAPDSWKILLNNRLIAKGMSNQPDSSVCLTASSLKSTDKITLSYISSNGSAGWNRTFFINDGEDQNLLTLKMDKQTGSVYLDGDKLKKLIAKSKRVYIYTISLPKDPSLAARVRVARVLLGKIDWLK